MQTFCQKLLSYSVDTLPGSLVVKFNHVPKINMIGSDSEEVRLIALTSSGMIYIWRPQIKFCEWEPWLSHNLLSYGLNDFKVSDIQLMNTYDGTLASCKIIWAEFDNQLENGNNELHIRSLSVVDDPVLNAIKMSARTTLFSLQKDDLTLFKLLLSLEGIWAVFLTSHGDISIYLYIFSTGLVSSITLPSNDENSTLIHAALLSNCGHKDFFIQKNLSLYVQVAERLFILASHCGGLSLKVIPLPTVNLPQHKPVDMIVSYESRDMTLLSVILKNGAIVLYQCNLDVCSATFITVVAPKECTESNNYNIIGLCDFSSVALLAENEVSDQYITLTFWSHLHVYIKPIKLPSRESANQLNAVPLQESVRFSLLPLSSCLF